MGVCRRQYMPLESAEETNNSLFSSNTKISAYQPQTLTDRESFLYGGEDQA